jgi:ABC-type taurine transport system substrate-binding protein
MTDQEIIKSIVTEVKDYQTAIAKYQAEKEAWEARKESMIAEVMKQTGIKKDDATRRVMVFMNDTYPRFK